MLVNLPNFGVIVIGISLFDHQKSVFCLPRKSAFLIVNTLSITI